MVELLAARAIGRNLTRIEGCAVQGIALLVFVGFIYWLLVSGTFFALVQPVVDWYVHQAFPRPTAAPL